MITTDVAPPTSATLARISDPRAVQYWDPDRALSAYLLGVAFDHPSWIPAEDRERLTAPDFIVWDAALVFAAGVRWDSTLPPPSFYGGPIVDELDAIRAALSGR